MNISCTAAVGALGFLLFANAPQAQGHAEYRGFQLGADLQSVSALAKVESSEAKTIHRRPALIQTLEWRPSYFMRGSTALQNDPVQLIVFSFYDDQLYQLVVAYARDRTDGMTTADMIDSLSGPYGSPSIPAVGKTTTNIRRVEAEGGTPVARWEDANSSVVLYQSSDDYRSSANSQFRLIVTSQRLDALSRSARTQALQLDEREAPQRELARQKKEVEDARASREKARAVNKAAFRP